MQTARSQRCPEEGAITDFIKAASNGFSQITLQGGNFEFPYGDTAFGLNCPQMRCDEGSLGTIDFSHDTTPPSLHLDTGDPFNFPAGTIMHGFVDVFLGNLWYQ